MRKPWLQAVKLVGLLALVVMSGLYLFQSFESAGKDLDSAAGEETEQETVYNTTEFIEGRVIFRG
jgi:hypothetical protein